MTGAAKYDVENVDNLVDFISSNDQWWRQLDDRIASVVRATDESSTKELGREVAPKQSLGLVIVKRLFGGLVLHEFDTVEVSGATNVADDGNVTVDVSDQASLEMLDSALVQDGTDVLVVHSMTKLHAVPGIRLGYVTGPAARIARLAALQPSWSIDATAMIAGPTMLSVDAVQRRALAEVTHVRALIASEQGVRQDCPVDVLASAPAGSDSNCMVVADGAVAGSWNCIQLGMVEHAPRVSPQAIMAIVGFTIYTVHKGNCVAASLAFPGDA